MLRKTLITMTAIAAMCAGSPVLAMHGGGGGGFGGAHVGGFGGGHVGGFSGGHPSGFGGGGFAPHGAGPLSIGPRAAAPIGAAGAHGRPGNNLGRNGFALRQGRDHFHDRFHHRGFYAYGFGGPYYDNACWTYDGVRWVYVCYGDQ
jgi:hypothetical protein